MTTRKNPADSGGVRALLVRLSGVLLGGAGLAMFLGGIQLVLLGGSPYYVLAGSAILISAVLLFALDHRTVWVYAAAWGFTLGWSIYEVGLDGWGLMPRLLALSAFGF